MTRPPRGVALSALALAALAATALAADSYRVDPESIAAN